MPKATALTLSGPTPPFREARRELSGLTAGVEKKALLWLAARVPDRVNPDHLTALGLFAMPWAGPATPSRPGIHGCCCS
jgi:hypothetical protein